VPELAAVTDLSGRAGFQLNRFKVVAGRIADLRAPDEATVDFPTADREDLGVGSMIRFIVGDPSAKPHSWPPFGSWGSWPHRGSSRPSALRLPLAACM
jgi:hypothetical protein